MKMGFLRLLLFLVHAIAALYLGVTHKSLVAESFAEVLSALPVGYPNHNLATTSLNASDCFYEVCSTYETVQKGLEWDVFALLAVFEWASASFALAYLGFSSMWCFLWNIAGAVLILYYDNSISILQVGITVLCLLVSSIAPWMIPDGVVLQYAEYCVSTPLAFLSVFVLFVPNAPSWAGILGVTSIFLCNLQGMGAYLSFIQNWEASELDTGGFFDLMRVRNHFKLFLLNAWLTLCMGGLVVVYLARDYLQGDPIVPWWTGVLMYNLLAMLALSCAWAVFCYSLYRRDWFERMGSGLAILDAAAKLPVVIYVYTNYADGI